MKPYSCSYEHDSFQLLISIFILIGINASYLPQHFKIIKTKSSAGISPYFLLLGTTSALCNVINILINQRNVIACCSSLTFGACFESVLGILQITSQWILFFIVFILFYLYFPEGQRLTFQTPHRQFSRLPTPPSEEWIASLRVFWAVWTHMLITIVITFLLLFGGEAWRRTTVMWANFNGLLSTALAMVQYIPQIIETWNRKECGALSIPMMLMQTPGAFIFAYSLASRDGTNWTTWITYLVAGLLQGVLLFMCIQFRYQFQRTNVYYGPVYIGNVQNALSNPSRLGASQGAQLGDQGHHLPSDSENVPLLNNHNPVASYEYQQAPHQRTKSLLSKWKQGQLGSKVHLVHHSLASNLSERDDTLR